MRPGYEAGYETRIGSPPRAQARRTAQLAKIDPALFGLMATARILIGRTMTFFAPYADTSIGNTVHTDDGDVSRLTDAIEGLRFRGLRRNGQAAAGYLGRYLGLAPSIHDLLNTESPTRPFSIILDDWVRNDIAAGAVSYAFGFLDHLTDFDSATLVGLGWEHGADHAWKTFVKDCPGAVLPVTTRHQTAIAGKFANAIHRLSLVIDGPKREVRWYMDGALVDTWAPTAPLGQTAPASKAHRLMLRYRAIVPANGDVSIRFHGGGVIDLLKIKDHTAGFKLATTPLAGTLARTTAGLIFHDDFNRADGAPGANWEVITGGANWTIVGNVLKNKSTADRERIAVAAAAFGAARAEMVAQTAMRRVGTLQDAFPGLAARWDTAGNNAYIEFISNSGGSAYTYLSRHLAGVEVELTPSGAPYADAKAQTFQTFKLAVKNSVQKLWRGAVLEKDGANADLNAVTGRAGLFCGWYRATTNYHEFDNFATYAKNSIVVGGLPAGHTAHAGSKSAAEVAGVATIDLAESPCPIGTISVRDAAGIIKARLNPAGGAYGGDEYTYSE